MYIKDDRGKKCKKYSKQWQYCVCWKEKDQVAVSDPFVPHFRFSWPHLTQSRPAVETNTAQVPICFLRCITGCARPRPAPYFQLPSQDFLFRAFACISWKPQGLVTCGEKPGSGGMRRMDKMLPLFFPKMNGTDTVSVHTHMMIVKSHGHKIPVDPWRVGVQNSKRVQGKLVKSAEARVLTAPSGHVFQPRDPIVCSSCYLLCTSQTRMLKMFM